MTDATLTPEVFGDFGLPLAQLRAAPQKLNIEVGDTVITRACEFLCIAVEDGHAWCRHVNSPKSAAYVWTVSGDPMNFGDAPEYRAIAVVKGGAA